LIKRFKDILFDLTDFLMNKQLNLVTNCTYLVSSKYARHFIFQLS